MQEIVIYDPPDIINKDSEIDGFVLVTTAGETTLYVKLSHRLLRKYLTVINSYKEIENIPIIKMVISKYQKNPEIKRNKELYKMLSEYFQNPLNLIKDWEQFIAWNLIHIASSVEILPD